MEAQRIATEHIFCQVRGKKHCDIFASAPNSLFCGSCGFKNPNPSRKRRTPALPGPDDVVVEIDDSLDEAQGSPASQLMRKRPKPAVSGIWQTQFLPNEQGLAD